MPVRGYDHAPWCTLNSSSTMPTAWKTTMTPTSRVLSHPVHQRTAVTSTHQTSSASAASIGSGTTCTRPRPAKNRPANRQHWVSSHANRTSCRIEKTLRRLAPADLSAAEHVMACLRADNCRRWAAPTVSRCRQRLGQAELEELEVDGAA